MLPSKIYTVKEANGSVHTLTVVDYTPVERILAQKAFENCPLGAETCLYTMTADEDFLLDRAGPLVVGGGCSGHAFKFGPLLGEFLADLALGQDFAVPRERFALQRPSLAVPPPS